MDVSSYVLLSQEQALRRRLDIAANNLANMNTVGFKREKPVFHEYVERTESAVDPARTTSFVLDYGAVHDSSAGAFQPTGNPLDAMIDGPGYFSVQAPDGSTAYTRAGFFQVLPTGEIATSSGQRVLGEGGQPITVPVESAGKVSIGADGTVSVPNTTGGTDTLGRIAVTVFANEATVNPRGDGLFSGTGGRELAATETKLHSGGVEASNVNAIQETTDMVEILRAYQNSQAMTQSMSDMRSKAIDRLGRFD